MQVNMGHGNEPARRVLIVEDDTAFADELSQMLTSFGLVIRQAATLPDADALIQSFTPDLVILDQFIGTHDALSNLAQLTVERQVPVVMLTGNNDEVDRIIALELGADDFICKTQRPREILARIRAVLRRITSSAEPGNRPRPETGGQGGNRWIIDRSARRVTTPTGIHLSLSSREYDCFIYLYDRKGQVVLRSEIFEQLLRRQPAHEDDRTVDNMISQIRAKIRPFVADINPIQSIRNQGYIIAGIDAEEI